MYWRATCCFIVSCGGLRLSGSIIRKSRSYFYESGEKIRQKSGCLNHSNERIFQLTQIQDDPGKGFICIKVWGFAFADFIR